MKTIPAENHNGVNSPSTIIPKDAKKVVFDGSNYLVYEEGDVIPAEPESKSMGNFLGNVVYSDRDVKKVVADAIENMFSASQGNIDTVSDQFKIVSEMIAIQFALTGWLSWAEIGLSGVTDEASAQKYFDSNIKPLWDTRNLLRQQAKQFILEHQ